MDIERLFELAETAIDVNDVDGLIEHFEIPEHHRELFRSTLQGLNNALEVTEHEEQISFDKFYEFVARIQEHPIDSNNRKSTVETILKISREIGITKS